VPFIQTSADWNLAIRLSITQKHDVSRSQHLALIWRREKTTLGDEEQHLVLDALIERWGEALEQKDPGTWTHCKRVAEFATVLVQALKLEEVQVRALACGALLHEIGKLEIPESILRKPAVLTAEERLVMREYCQRGYEIVRREASLRDAAEIVRSHREWFDGTGYPRGLKGETIPIGARIVALVDAFEMIVRDRPHRGAHSFAVARAEIQRWSGRMFDPRIVDAFLNVPDEDWERAQSAL
jgi:HD-GYP domain-containing protein (c-di-GMP phosphodiesterase class II)